jgi:hypothetical protein
VTHCLRPDTGQLVFVETKAVVADAKDKEGIAWQTQRAGARIAQTVVELDARADTDPLHVEGDVVGQRVRDGAAQVAGQFASAIARAHAYPKR